MEQHRRASYLTTVVRSLILDVSVLSATMQSTTVAPANGGLQL